MSVGKSGSNGEGSNSSLSEKNFNIELLPGTSSSTPSSFESTIYFIKSPLMLSRTTPSWLDPGKHWGFVDAARYGGSPEDQKLSPVTASTSRFSDESKRTDLNYSQESALACRISRITHTLIEFQLLCLSLGPLKLCP